MISKLHLSHFRNFESRTLSFSPQVTIIVGPNAAGKTNILEALYMISLGKSFRVRVEEEMISYGEELGRIKGRIVPNGDESSSKTDLEVILTRGEISVATSQVQSVPRKKLLVSGVSKRLVDFAGNFKAVLFGPWDMDLVTDAPSLRRRFLDTVLSQVDREYRRALMSYEKGLRQRNKLLFRIREENIPRQQLVFWDKLIIKNGDYISLKREEFIAFVNQTKGFDGREFTIEYDKSAISEGRLAQYANEEISAATTLVGPHRDDFIFIEGKRDMARYGSRGEQRMAVLWLKLAEIDFIQEKTGERPTLLLDDIFSELDHRHRDMVLIVANQQQTIITTADPHMIEKDEKTSRIDL